MVCGELDAAAAVVANEVVVAHGAAVVFKAVLRMSVVALQSCSVKAAGGVRFRWHTAGSVEGD
eukprot:4853088-Pleurochrysis_carterae.AAC.1